MTTTPEFKTRRQVILDQLNDDCIVVVPAAQERFRNADVAYRFRQDSDFFYLTGFSEPDAVMLLVPQHSAGEYWLFCPPVDEKQAVWTGPQIDCTRACEEYDVDQAYPLPELSGKLTELLAERSQIYYAFNKNPTQDQQLLQLCSTHHSSVRAGKLTAHSFHNIAPLIHQQRVVKSDSEIELMRTAAEISTIGHIRAMQAVKKAQYEYELEAELLYEFYRHGCHATAYDSIVASGSHACILHYTANNARLRKDQLILIDAGAEYEHYAADITRTFPYNGKFSPEQKEIYQLVLAAQLAGIDKVRPGTAWPEIQKTILKVLVEGLVDLSILQGNVEELIHNKAYLPFYMHGSGHWLGLDVHDAGPYKVNNEAQILQPNMTLTVEPGLYFSANHQTIDPKWRGIGIRIEDDVLVTKNNPEILSKNAPKNIDEIESLVI